MGQYSLTTVRCYSNPHSNPSAPDVVEIPDVFLPAEEYLDMFDSASDSSGDLGHNDSDAEMVEVS
jgi:hypothetical protein